MENIGLKQLLAAVAVYASFAVSVSTAQTQDGLLLEDYEGSYTVVEGDTLWDIASQFLQDPLRWPEVWQQNRYINNPDLIYPGDVISIGFVDGRPVIMLQRAVGQQGGSTSVNTNRSALDQELANRQASGDGRTVTLTPQMRAMPLRSAIPAIPIELIENSFTHNRIVQQSDYESAPYIVANLRNNLTISTGDEVYARGQWPGTTASFEVYRQSTVYMDPTGKEQLGVEMEYLGFATISKDEENDIKRLLINTSSKEIRVGDRLLVREQSRLDPNIQPTEPSADMEGEIIALLGKESLASQLDTVVLNLGTEDGLEIGHILAIRKPGGRVVDQVALEQKSVLQRFGNSFSPDRLQLPADDVGTLLIYKSFERMSYGTILTLTEPVSVRSLVGNP